MAARQPEHDSRAIECVLRHAKQAGPAGEWTVKVHGTIEPKWASPDDSGKVSSGVVSPRGERCF